MRIRSAAPTVAMVLSVTLLAGCGGNKASVASGRLITKSIEALESVKSFRQHQVADWATFSKDYPNQLPKGVDPKTAPHEVDVVGSADDTNYQVTERWTDGGEMSIRFVDRGFYMKANSSGWYWMLGDSGRAAKMTGAFGDKWIKIQDADDEALRESGELPSVALNKWRGAYEKIKTSTAAAKSETVDGKPVYHMSQDGVDLVINRDSSLPKKLSMSGVAVEWDEWDSVVPVAVPSDDELVRMPADDELGNP